MNKAVIELERGKIRVNKNPEKRYDFEKPRAIINESGYLSLILDNMVNWSQEESNKGFKIYRHSLYVEMENEGEQGSDDCVDVDVVVYLNIYFQ